jgi:hypothetical protein
MLRPACGVIAITAAMVLTLGNACPSAYAGGDVNLTGKWLSDFEGGVYYLRQVGQEVWWMGGSEGKGKTRGKDWTNIGHGTIKGDQLTIKWADVPRGSNMGPGVLTFQLVSKKGQVVALKKIRQVGDDFGGDTWRRAK